MIVSLCVSISVIMVEVNVTRSCANLLVITTNTSGIIRSTIRNGHYSNNMNCQWNFTSDVKLKLVFLHFKTYSSADYVNVYDGGSPASPLLGTFSGSALPAPIMSSSNKLYVTFTTDGSGNSEPGFTATYKGNEKAFRHMKSNNNKETVVINIVRHRMLLKLNFQF